MNHWVEVMGSLLLFSIFGSKSHERKVAVHKPEVWHYGQERSISLDTGVLVPETKIEFIFHTSQRTLRNQIYWPGQILYCAVLLKKIVDPD